MTPKRLCRVLVVMVMLAGAMFSGNAARAQEDDWLRRLVLGLEVPGAATNGIHLPNVLAELENAQNALAKASDALAQIESNEHIRDLQRAAASARDAVLAYLDMSLNHAADVVTASDGVATQVDAVGEFSTAAGDGLNTARAALLEARDATPEPAYQAALNEADDAIAKADHARLEVRDAATRAGLAIGDARAEAAESHHELEVTSAVAAEKKRLDEPFIDLIRRSATAVADGIDARAGAAAAGTTVIDSASRVASPTLDLQNLVAAAVERAQKARDEAVEAGASTADIDGAILQLADVRAGTSFQIDLLQVAQEAAVEIAAAIASPNEEVTALRAVAESEATGCKPAPGGGCYTGADEIDMGT